MSDDWRAPDPLPPNAEALLRTELDRGQTAEQAACWVRHVLGELDKRWLDDLLTMATALAVAGIGTRYQRNDEP